MRLIGRSRELTVPQSVTDIENELRRLRKRILPTDDARIEVRDRAFLDVSARAGTETEADRRWVLWQAVKNAAPAGEAAAVIGSPSSGAGDFIRAAFESIVGREVPVDGIELLEGGDLSKIRLPERTYALVHVDVDLYEPTLACLRRFGPLVATGGVIVLEDYCSPEGPGVRAAADVYLGETAAFQPWHLHTQQLVLTKRG